MKPSNIWSRLILIALALLLGVAKSGHPSPRPTPEPNKSTQVAPQQTAEQPAPVSAAYLAKTPNNANSPATKEKKGSDAPTVVIAFFTVISGLAAVAIAVFNWKLVGVTRDMHKATMAATEVAKESRKIAELALNETRPYIFVEKQSIHFYPEAARSFSPLFAILSGQEIDVTQEPLSHSSEWKGISTQIWFEAANRGKSTAVIQAVTTKVFSGYGLTNEPKINIKTMRRIQTGIPTHIVETDQRTTIYTTFDIPLELWSDILALKTGLFILLRIKFRDVYRRSFSIVFPFHYEPPLRNKDGEVMRPPQLVQRQRSKPRYL